jgi:hypothetical protein
MPSTYALALVFFTLVWLFGIVLGLAAATPAKTNREFRLYCALVLADLVVSVGAIIWLSAIVVKQCCG